MISLGIGTHGRLDRFIMSPLPVSLLQTWRTRQNRRCLRCLCGVSLWKTWRPRQNRRCLSCLCHTSLWKTWRTRQNRRCLRCPCRASLWKTWRTEQNRRCLRCLCRASLSPVSPVCSVRIRRRPWHDGQHGHAAAAKGAGTCSDTATWSESSRKHQDRIIGTKRPLSSIWRVILSARTKSLKPW